MANDFGGRNESVAVSERERSSSKHEMKASDTHGSREVAFNPVSLGKLRQHNNCLVTICDACVIGRSSETDATDILVSPLASLSGTAKRPVDPHTQWGSQFAILGCRVAYEISDFSSTEYYISALLRMPRTGALWQHARRD